MIRRPCGAQPEEAAAHRRGEGGGTNTPHQTPPAIPPLLRKTRGGAAANPDHFTIKIDLLFNTTHLRAQSWPGAAAAGRAATHPSV